MKLLILSCLMGYLSFSSTESGSKIVIDDLCTVNFVGAQGTFSCTATSCAEAWACAQGKFNENNQ